MQKQINLLTGRLLSQINTNPYSQTYGCFDRDFWHYKTLRDFPSAPFQQGVLSLALIYSNNFEGNKFYKNEKVLELIKAGINYWVSIQNRDGSFNEWYPNEHSQVATAFTTYAITETMLIFKEELILSKRVLQAVRKAGDWLCKNPDRLVTNHTAGSLAALQNIFLLTGAKKYLRGVKRHLSAVLKNQDNEGWFLEYDGCDLGYLSVTIYFLKKYQKRARNKEILPTIEKAEKFLAHFAHPDGTCGGEYGSRNTKYAFGNIAEETIFSADDRYFTFFFLPNFLEVSPEKTLEKTLEIFQRDFPKAGMFAKKNDKYHIVLNYKKGGVVKIFSVPDKKLVYADTGYVLRSKRNTLYSQNHQGNVSFKVKKEDDSTNISLEQRFSFFEESYPMRKLFVPFRLFNYMLGWNRSLMYLFNKRIKKKMILKEELSGVRLMRVFSIKESEVEINDEIVSGAGGIVSREKVNNISFRHVPSSKFFRANDFFFTPDNTTDVKISF